MSSLIVAKLEVKWLTSAPGSAGGTQLLAHVPESSQGQLSGSGLRWLAFSYQHAIYLSFLGVSTLVS